MIPLSIAVAALGLVAADPASGAPPSSPETLSGLAAWYTVDSLHEQLRDRDSVVAWSDSSGHGHDLTYDKNGLASVFHTVALAGKPVVEVRVGTFSVRSPFPLEDHTIFLVAAYGGINHALFSSATSRSHGVVLSHGGNEHRYQNGKSDRLVSYGRLPEPPRGFHIAVLAREAGQFRLFLNGSRVGSGEVFTEPIEVGRWFGLDHTKFVQYDGRGMRVAEIAIFDRYLSDDERGSVTEYFARRYGLEVKAPTDEAGPVAEAPPDVPPVPDESAVQAWLGTTSQANLNAEGVAVEWDRQVKLEAPFRRAPEEPSKLYCTRDAQVRLFVRLPLRTEQPAARVRVLILKNRKDYLTAEQTTSPFTSGPAGLQATVQFAGEVSLAAGDFVEIVVSRVGEDGSVTVLPEQAILAAAVQEQPAE